MKLLSLLTTATLAATAALQPALPPSSRLAARDTPDLEGGFVKHCYTYNVGQRGEIKDRLLGDCGDDELYDMLHPMWLDLNLCLANNNGDLRWESNGNAFDINCKECKGRRFNTQWIECLCRDGAQRWKYTTLDLNEGIRYDQDAHVLACFDHLGVVNSMKA